MANPSLIHHNDTQFAKSVLELGDGVWGAIGFAASNVYMVEGRSSVTIIDTTESTSAAETILDEFRRKTDKPIGRIIFTHSHRDHISGAKVFAGGRDLPIIASAAFSSDLVDVDAEAILPGRALARRTQAQFGIGLTPQQRVSLGCGPGDRPMRGLGAGFLPPNQHVDHDCGIDLDGVEAQLLLAPGETADHMVVWLPATGVLFCGDNWYHAFPNLYAIRGTPYRDFAAWADSLERLAELNANILAPGHTRPVIGADLVRKVLTTTCAAIRHVMRETADMMDRGLTMDDIAATIALPEELADLPWLGEFYGKIGWSARAYAAGTLGWYDGNPTHLTAIPSKERAKLVADLCGGVEQLMTAARTAEDLRWRLELCDHLIALGEPAEQIKADAMSSLAEQEVNATARNTYLWEAERLREAGSDNR